jgi:hypothetical protein
MNQSKVSALKLFQLAPLYPYPRIIRFSELSLLLFTDTRFEDCFSEEANLISQLTGLKNAINMDQDLFPKGECITSLEMKRNQKKISRW